MESSPTLTEPTAPAGNLPPVPALHHHTAAAPVLRGNTDLPLKIVGCSGR